MQYEMGSNGMHRRRGRRVGRVVARGLVLGVALVALALAAVGGGHVSHAAAHAHDDTPTITIQIPVPDSNGVAQGPVGANLTLIGSGFTDGHTYQLGYAPQSGQCATGGPTFANGTVTSSGGSFTDTLKWPVAAANVGGEYFICALDTTDTTQPPVQSTTMFRVVTDAAPAFTLQDPTTSAPIPGPPYALRLGEQVTIAGHNFRPAGLTLVAYLSQHEIKSGSDLDNANPLNTTNATTITTQDSGDVNATVQIPGSIDTGSYYLYLVSSDRQGSSLPSVMAFVRVRLSQQPTPTPSPKPTVAPKPTPTPGSSTSPGLSPKRMLAVIGLSLLSLILLVAGVLLLAGGGPRRTP